MISQLTSYHGQPHANLHLLRSNCPLLLLHAQYFRNLLQNTLEYSFLQTTRKRFIKIWWLVDVQNTVICYKALLCYKGVKVKPLPFRGHDKSNKLLVHCRPLSSSLRLFAIVQLIFLEGKPWGGKRTSHWVHHAFDYTVVTQYLSLPRRYSPWELPEKTEKQTPLEIERVKVQI